MERASTEKMSLTNTPIVATATVPIRMQTSECDATVARTKTVALRSTQILRRIVQFLVGTQTNTVEDDDGA